MILITNQKAAFPTKLLVSVPVDIIRDGSLTRVFTFEPLANPFFEAYRKNGMGLVISGKIYFVDIFDKERTDEVLLWAVVRDTKPQGFHPLASPPHFWRPEIMEEDAALQQTRIQTEQ